MMAENTGISFWLIPEGPAFQEFAAQTKRLSVIGCVANLEPHLTIYVGKLDNLGSLNDLIEDIFGNCVPLNLTAGIIGWSGEFAKSFYLTFDKTSELMALHNSLREKLGNPLNYQLDPHLSLFYQKGNLLQKRALASEIDFSGRRIHFDSVWVTSHPQFIESEKDIAAFSVLKKIRLLGERA